MSPHGQTKLFIAVRCEAVNLALRSVDPLRADGDTGVTVGL